VRGKILIHAILVPILTLPLRNSAESAPSMNVSLKKGFKEMFGTTIFDFYQKQRMEHARFLLYEKGLSVSEVSALLVILLFRIFSTAFKKHTGIKPVIVDPIKSFSLDIRLPATGGNLKES
jgi:methylphosphotriester-DNA--protein-cysteine methyltransferase